MNESVNAAALAPTAMATEAPGTLTALSLSQFRRGVIALLRCRPVPPLRSVAAPLTRVATSNFPTCPPALSPALPLSLGVLTRVTAPRSDCKSRARHSSKNRCVFPPPHPSKDARAAAVNASADSDERVARRMSRRSITIETSAYRYSEHEEHDQINQYWLQQEIGSGEFGKVRRCVSDIDSDNRTYGPSFAFRR